jgi:cytochrome P450
MRLWSVVGVGTKRVLTQDVHYEDFLLPKGSVFHANFHSMARQPWMDRPDEFLPERWSDANPQLPRLKEMFMPFGAGQRQCMGQNLARMQVTLIAAFTMRFFDFDLLSGPIVQKVLIVKPVDMEVRVHLRE